MIARVVAFSLALGLHTSLIAQPPDSSGSAAGCLRQAADLRTRRRAELQRSGKPLDAEAARRIGTEVRNLGAACAARMDVSNPGPAEYPALAQLYLLVGDTAKAIGWVERGLTSLRATQRQKAELLLSGIRVSMAGVGAMPDTLKLSESYMRQLDLLPDSLGAMKLAGHALLLAHYDYADVDALVLGHAKAIVDIANRVRDTSELALTAYTSVARATADYGHADSALAILDHGEAELASLFPRERIERAFADSRREYRLVGQPAPPIRGDYWLNAQPDQPELRFDDGRVRLLQFGAHWCIPCRNSYPAITRMTGRFAGAPFETVFETELYGYFDGKPADAETEVADDLVYYAEQHRFRFKIAIWNPRQKEALSSNEEHYAVLGIPQTVIVDKRGRIRAMVNGWDVGNEARLTRLIGELLAEP